MRDQSRGSSRNIVYLRASSQSFHGKHKEPRIARDVPIVEEGVQPLRATSHQAFQLDQQQHNLRNDLHPLQPATLHHQHQTLFLPGAVEDGLIGSDIYGQATYPYDRGARGIHDDPANFALEEDGA